MAPGGDEGVDQGVSLIRRTIYLVSGLLHLFEQLHCASRGIETDGVPDAGVFGRVVGEENGDFLFFDGCAPEAGEAGCEAGDPAPPFGICAVDGERRADRRLVLRTISEALLEGERNGDYASVELGDGYLPRHVER